MWRGFVCDSRGFHIQFCQVGQCAERGKIVVIDLFDFSQFQIGESRELAEFTNRFAFQSAAFTDVQVCKLWKVADDFQTAVIDGLFPGVPAESVPSVLRDI